jgi:uncharacterized protein with ParB-like and HNH nuclease domain
MGLDIKIHNRMNIVLETPTVKQLIEMIDDGTIQLDPEYQRPFKWSSDLQIELLKSWYNQYPVNSAMLIKQDCLLDLGKKYNVLDGKQRLTTIYNFVKGKSNIKLSIKDKREKLFRELSSGKQEKLLSLSPIPLLYYNGIDSSTDMQGKYFINCQNSIPVTTKEKQNANSFNVLIRKIEEASYPNKEKLFRLLRDKDSNYMKAMKYLYFMMNGRFNSIRTEDEMVKKIQEVKSINQGRITDIIECIKNVNKIVDEKSDKLTILSFIALIYLSISNEEMSPKKLYKFINAKTVSFKEGEYYKPLKSLFEQIKEKYSDIYIPIKLVS